MNTTHTTTCTVLRCDELATTLVVHPRRSPIDPRPFAKHYCDHHASRRLAIVPGTTGEPLHEPALVGDHQNPPCPAWCTIDHDAEEVSEAFVFHEGPVGTVVVDVLQDHGECTATRVGVWLPGRADDNTSGIPTFPRFLDPQATRTLRDSLSAALDALDGLGAANLPAYPPRAPKPALLRLVSDDEAVAR